MAAAGGQETVTTAIGYRERPHRRSSWLCAQLQCYLVLQVPQTGPRGCHVYPAGFLNFLEINRASSAANALDASRKIARSVPHSRCKPGGHATGLKFGIQKELVPLVYVVWLPRIRPCSRGSRISCVTTWSGIGTDNSKNDHVWARNTRHCNVALRGSDSHDSHR